MAAVVLDASAALAFLAASQATPASEAFRLAAAGLSLIAPSAFRLEMRHALLKMERRRLVAPTALDKSLPALERMIAIAPPPSDADLVCLIAVARDEGLGLYDACYFELARAERADLASRDGALIDAARKRGLPTRDLR